MKSSPKPQLLAHQHILTSIHEITLIVYALAFQAGFLPPLSEHKQFPCWRRRPSVMFCSSEESLFPDHHSIRSIVYFADQTVHFIAISLFHFNILFSN